MKKIIIHRLFQSISELEQAIASARLVLKNKRNVPAALIERMKMYDEILVKQRELATVLCGHAAIGNWGEVSRHIKLINALSHMISDDAREILTGVQAPTEEDRHDVIFC